MWEKFKAQVAAHPYLFGGVALAIIVWIFWPSGAAEGDGGASDRAVQSQAIAATAAANAQLMLASEETQRVGLQVNAATTLGQAQIAAQTEIARLQSQAMHYEMDTAVKLADIAAAGQGKQMDMILASQNSAQQWAMDVEKQSGILPGNFAVTGFINSGPSIVKAAPTSTIYTGTGSVYTPDYNTFGDKMSSDNWYLGTAAGVPGIGGYSGFGGQY